MIATLLKRDPLIRAQPWVVLIVAAMTAVLGRLLLNVVNLFEGMSSSSGEALFQTGEVSPLVTGFLAFQGLVISVTVCAAWNKKRDGAELFSRSRPFELFLPISPRDAWLARLLAHGVMVVMPLLAISMVVHLVPGRPHFSAIGIVGSSALSMVLLIFSRGPERAGLTRIRDAFGVIATVSPLLVIMLLDLGVFSDDLITGPPWATAVVLLLAAMRARATHRRLPKAWLLPASFVQRRPEHEAALAAVEQALPTFPRWRRLRVCAATVWTNPGMALCHMGLVVVPVYGALTSPWVPVLMCAGLLVGSAHQVLAHSKFLGALPVSRRSLLLVTLVPSVLSIGLGCLIAQGWKVWRHSERPVVTLDKQVLREPAPADGFDVWLDVVVPRHAWRFVGEGEIPEQVAPNGERIRPRAVPVLGLSSATVYNPYDAPFGASQAFTAWQFSRALEAVQGVVIAPEQLSERYLETRKSGEVSLSSEQVRRNLDHHEAVDGPWYGSMGTLVSDYPTLAPRWDGRRAALPVLAVSLLGALGCVLLLRFRTGSRMYKLAHGMMMASFGVAMAADMWMDTALKAGHPQVLFSILGEAVLSGLPSNLALLWAFTAAIAVSAFMVMARAVDMAEAVTGQVQPPTRFTE